MDNQQVNALLAHREYTDYLATKDGVIYSIRTRNMKQLTQHLHTARGRKRYLRVRIGERLYLSHRFIVEVFHGRLLQPDEYVNHIDGDTLNNTVTNLEIVSHHENVKHAVENGLYSSGDDWHKARR